MWIYWQRSCRLLHCFWETLIQVGQIQSNRQIQFTGFLRFEMYIFVTPLQFFNVLLKVFFAKGYLKNSWNKS